jgi:hypothetical protein
MRNCSRRVSEYPGDRATAFEQAIGLAFGVRQIGSCGVVSEDEGSPADLGERRPESATEHERDPQRPVAAFDNVGFRGFAVVIWSREHGASHGARIELHPEGRLDVLDRREAQAERGRDTAIIGEQVVAVRPFDLLLGEHRKHGELDVPLVRLGLRVGVRYGVEGDLRRRRHRHLVSTGRSRVKAEKGEGEGSDQAAHGAS